MDAALLSVAVSTPAGGSVHRRDPVLGGQLRGVDRDRMPWVCLGNPHGFGKVDPRSSFKSAVRQSILEFSAGPIATTVGTARDLRVAASLTSGVEPCPLRLGAEVQQVVGIVALDTDLALARSQPRSQTPSIIFPDARHRCDAHGRPALRFSLSHLQTVVDHEHKLHASLGAGPAEAGRPAVKPTAQAMHPTFARRAWSCRRRTVHGEPASVHHAPLAQRPHRLRSDTVTQPHQPCVRPWQTLRWAMTSMEKTLQWSERRVAALCGMEASLFLPSGTMANAVAVRTHTRPGDEIVLEREAHIYLYEGGGFAALSGCSVAFVDGDRGRMAPEHVRAAIRKAEGSGSHYPDGRLICKARPTGRWIVYGDDLDAIAAIGHDTGCALHVDGARLMNAVVATGTSAKRMLQGGTRGDLSFEVGRTDGLHARREHGLHRPLPPVAEDVRYGMRQVGIVLLQGCMLSIITSIGWPRIMPAPDALLRP